MVSLYHGDCLEIMPGIADQSVDLILADLPYGTTQNDWDVVIPMQPLWEQYRRIIKPNGAIVLTSAQPFTSMLVMAAIDLFRYDLVWEKSIATGFLNANRMPLRGHESVLVFYKALPTYNPQKFMLHTPSFKKTNTTHRKTANYGDFDPFFPSGTTDGSRHPRSVFSVRYEPDFFDSSEGGKRTVHPTQKPVTLMEYLIRTYANEGDTVMDNCMGSGTTGVAAMRCNRRFIGIEREEEYVRIATARIEHAQQQREMELV